MKKFAKFTLGLALGAILMGTTAIAATTMSAGLASNKTKMDEGEEVTITVSVNNFSASDKGIVGMEAQLSYDTTVFETLSTSDFTAQNGWKNLEFAPETNRLTILNSDNVKTDQALFTVTLKAKSDAKAGNTTVTLKDIKVTEGDLDSSDISLVSKSVTITVGTVQQPSTPSNNTTTNGTTNTTTNTSGNNGGVVLTNKVTNTTTSGSSTPINKVTNQTVTKLPKAGLENIVLPIIAVIAIVGFISYIRYRNTQIEP